MQVRQHSGRRLRSPKFSVNVHSCLKIKARVQAFPNSASLLHYSAHKLLLDRIMSQPTSKKASYCLTAGYADQKQSALQAVETSGRAWHLNMAMQGLKRCKMFRHKKQWWCPLRATVSDLAPHQQRTGKRSSTINLLLPRSPAPNWPMKRNYRQDQNPGLDRGECYFTNRRVVIETGIPLSISGNGISCC